MLRSARSRNTVLVAGFVALVYASLAVVAATCAFSHVDPSNSHAHHGTQESAPHNALCAWACQVTSEGGLVASAPADTSELVSLAPEVFLVESLTAIPSPSLHSRAPPIFTLG
jgi:hypothetical protein